MSSLYPQVSKAQRGGAETDLLWLIGLLALLFVLWVATGGPKNWEATAGPFLEPPPPLGTGEIYGPTSLEFRGAAPSDPNPPSSAPANFSGGNYVGPRSPYAGVVSLQHGNEQYTIRPQDEYIVIASNYGENQPINISGWRLMNGKAYRGGVPTVAVIPFGVRLFSPINNNVPRDPILLAPGGRAIITTGSFSRTSPFPINTSFLVNSCSGYLEDIKNYNFQPPIWSQCPLPRGEYGTMFLEDKCYDFIKNLSACHEPVYDERWDGEDHVDYVDEQEDNLSRQCKTYLADHFNYNRCVVWHGTDADFYGDEWRVFLGQRWEMWDDERETIFLFDSAGRLVDQLSY